MDISKLTYRFMTIDDLPTYLELYDSIHYIMKSPKFPRIRANISSKFGDPRRKTVGVFDENNNLVSAITGYFPEIYGFWYNTFHLIRSENESLSKHIDFIEMFNNSIKLLTDHGEENGYYGFYIRRLIPHQKSHEKLLKLALKRGAISDIRYDCLWEEVYEPMNITAKKSNHKFFFPEDGDFGIDVATVIVLFSLRQQYREELLSRKYPNYIKN